MAGIFFDSILTKSVGIIEMAKYKSESHIRSILKACSWRLMGTIATMLVVWFVTKEISFAAKIGLFDTVFKIGAFYVHERFWHNVKLGRLKSPDYEI
jgi:uncharacterized membrane protein